MEHEKYQEVEKYLKTFIDNTDTFCVYPWMHIATNNQGDYKLCCKADHSIPTNQAFEQKQKTSKMNASIDSLKDVWNSSYMKDVRKRMLNGERVDACIDCYREEEQSSDAICYRKRQNRIELLPSSKNNGKIIKHRVNNMNGYEVRGLPLMLDLTLDSKCNLTCAMCQPQDSTGVEDFMNKQINIGNKNKLPKNMIEALDTLNETYIHRDWTESDVFIKSIEDASYTLQEIYATGGEPFLVQSLWSIYEKMIDLELSKNIELSYCSNLTVTSKKKLDTIKKFKRAIISASIDGYGKEYDFTRWPSNWNKIDKTVNKLIKNWVDDKFNLHFCYVYSTITVTSLPDFIIWLKKCCDNINNMYNNNIELQALESSPKYMFPVTTLNQCVGTVDGLNIHFLSKKIKDYLIGYLENNINVCDNIAIPSISIKQEYLGVIDALKNTETSSDWKHKKEFWNYISLREKYIGINLNDVLTKEYYNLLS